MAEPLASMAPGGAAGRQRLWSGRHSRYISQPVLLEEVGPPGAVRGAILLMASCIAGFLLWSAVTRLTETTHAAGFVTPAGSVMVVQHLEGGIVREIYAHDGALLEAGQPVVRLDGTAAEANLREERARLAAYELQSERLRAFANGRTPDFTDYPAAFGGLVADQLAVLKLQTEARDKQRRVLDLQISQRKAELAALEGQRKTLAERVRIVGEMLRMREKLLKKGLVSRILYLTTKQEYSASRGEEANTVEKIARAREAIAEAEGKLAQMEADLRNQAADQMGRLTGEVTASRQTVRRLEDRVARLIVRSPAKGLLKGLTVNTIGSVVPPGGVIADIVPVDADLVVEARLSPSDIGHLEVGQHAAVKVQSYDFARFGSVEGTLERISATTFTSQDGATYYKATIRLAKNYVGDDPLKNLILPGMTVNVDVNTGAGSLMRYLLRPIYASIDRAFSEH